jgi:cytochrome c peroxidase
LHRIAVFDAQPPQHERSIQGSGLAQRGTNRPYFHGGRIATLESVIDYCAKTSQQPNKDNDLPAIQLIDKEK